MEDLLYPELLALEYERNLYLAQCIHQLPLQTKREVLAEFRAWRESGRNNNLLLLHAGGATVGEFSTIDTLMNRDSKEAFLQRLAQRLERRRPR